MKERPTSITVIAWILIVMGVIALIASSISLNNPMTKDIMGRSPIPIPVQYVMMYAGLLVQLVSGIAMLKGQNWARFLYVIWSIIGLVVGFATSPMKTAIIPSVVIFLIIAFFLFRPAANEYFSGAEVKSDAESN